MCVIIIKPRGAKMPTKREFLQAKIVNPHGFGFVSESMHYKSTDFEDFYNHIKRVPKSENCIIHFRYATQGSVRIKNCHPFYCDGVWFAHNGCLPYAPKGDMTDSEFAFRNFLLPPIKENGIESPEAEEAISNIIGWSKFAFMIDGEIYKFGQFVEYEGRYYSNMRHLYFASRAAFAV